MDQGHGTLQQMSNEELEQHVLRITRNLRPQSRWALEQWIRLLDVEAVPGFLGAEKPSVPGDPVELYFLPNLTIDTRDRFERRARKR